MAKSLQYTCDFFGVEVTWYSSLVLYCTGSAVDSLVNRWKDWKLDFRRISDSLISVQDRVNNYTYRPRPPRQWASRAAIK